MSEIIQLGTHSVAQYQEPVFFAEVGSFFNGSCDKAMQLIRQIVAASKRTTLPVVLKTEILSNPDICLKSDLIERYVNKSGEIKTENYRELIERKSMSLEDYTKIFRYLDDEGMPFVVSVYDMEAADFAREFGAAGLKIASANVTHVPLIRHVASLGIPVIVDSGRAMLSELAKAVETIRIAGNEQIILQHSPDGHPALPQAHNLKMIESYHRSFNLPVGLSDHHINEDMLLISTALGAAVLEKGIYDNVDELDQDIAHSMDIRQIDDVISSIKDAWLALGHSYRAHNMKIEGNIGSSQRQGLVAKQPLEPGDEISLESIRFAFPCQGIPVHEWDTVSGMKITSNISDGQPITWHDVSK